MAKSKVQKRTHAVRTEFGPDDSYTVTRFCEAEDISPPKYYELKKRGLGPVEYRDGKMIRITAQARRDWQQMMQRRAVTADTSTNIIHAAKAAAASVASPNHVARRRAGRSR